MNKKEFINKIFEFDKKCEDVGEPNTQYHIYRHNEKKGYVAIDYNDWKKLIEQLSELQ